MAPGGAWLDTVTVQVTVAPVEAGVTVYLRAFDPDDPSTDGDAVDDGPAGQDNKDKGKRIKLGAKSGQTLANGVFETTFTVSRQPGDNYRVAATLFEEANLDELSDEGYPNVPASDSQVPTFFGTLSRLLTVWRRLHIEHDSMGAVPTPKPSPDRRSLSTGIVWHVGSMLGGDGTVIPDTQWQYSVLELSAQVPGDAGFYDGGRIAQGAQTFPIRKTIGKFIEVKALPTFAQQFLFIGRSFLIFDDDDDLLPAGVSLPYYSLVGPLTVSRYERAYIELGVVPAGLNPRPLVPFSLNEQIDDYWGGTVLDDSKDLQDSESFWAHTLVAAYQPEASGDNDPHTEEYDVGNSYDPRRVGAIYLESLREDTYGALTQPGGAAEFFETMYELTAHEIGHMPGGKEDHWEGGLMGDFMTGEFSDHTLKRFREASSWYDGL